MFGLSIYLMYLADYISGRKNKLVCRMCGLKLKTESELDIHIRNDHKNDA
jgi:hypothetical protein